MTTTMTTFLGIVGVVGGSILTALGGASDGLNVLLVAMFVDYVTGIAIAIFWNASPKSEGGALDSKAGFQGLMRKGMMLLIIWIGCQVDVFVGFPMARNGLIIAFLVNELISISENAAIMGVPLPKAFTNLIDYVKTREEKANDEQNSNN